MKYLDEYHDDKMARGLLDRIDEMVTQPWTIMEVCGGQTHTIVRQGIDQLLPDLVELVHGPGCPVCVTPLGVIDHALELARRPEVVLCSFGDMLRVPGSGNDLLQARAAGADVRIVYSPLDAVRVAADNPDRTVVFFAVGFETTAPANAMAVLQARDLGLTNFCLLVAHVLVPPAMTAILTSPANRVQAFLGPGHVCTVVGWSGYEAIASEFGVPIVITGFEPVDLLEGILAVVTQLEQGRHEVENQYARAARRDGNPAARDVVDEVFEPCDRAWRGIGVLPASGLRLRPGLARFDAALRFPSTVPEVSEHAVCIAGTVLQGRAKPDECRAFGTACTPDHPLGAPMVSSEGACAAYFAAGRVARVGSVGRGGGGNRG
jgi:hydrogenase expression/formation protein HypD